MRLLERDAALAQLDAALAEAAEGRGAVALVSGEAGIGKSSLVRAFTAGVRGSAPYSRTFGPACPTRSTAIAQTRPSWSNGRPSARCRAPAWSASAPPNATNSTVRFGRQPLAISVFARCSRTAVPEAFDPSHAKQTHA